jgi:hypothetical protein
VEYGEGPVSRDADDLLPAEVKLLDAVLGRKQCDLIGQDCIPSSQDIERWTDEYRMIRASILRRLLLGGQLNTPSNSFLDAVSLRGAIIGP